MMIQQGALTGIRVLDLSRMLPGPYCSMVLADHGADVIAIEDTRFQQDGLFFNDLNRNKRHMSLNLKTDQGLEIFFRLAAEADVILEGFRPGVVSRLGIDYEAVQKCNPGIIYCSISGYGQNGPLAGRVGHDVNYLSRAGILDLIGEKGRGPCIPAVQIADVAGGSMNAAVGILLALFSREKTGVGQYIDISMADGVIGLLALPKFFADRDGERVRAGDALLSHRYACYNVYTTNDKRYISIGAVENRFWKSLCMEIDRPQYIDLQYDDDRREEIINDLSTVFKQKNYSQWIEVLGKLDVCFAEVQRMDEVLADPLFLEREMVYSYRDGEGNNKHGFGIAVKMSKTPGSIRRNPGRFGEDTRQILAESGYSESEIKDFYDGNVVWGE